MTVLALQIGDSEFAAGRVDGPEDADDEIVRIPVPARGAWDACRNLLLEVAAGDEVTAIGIASSGPIDMAAGVIAPAEITEWRAGFTIVDAASKAFPAAKVSLALDGACLAMAEHTAGGSVDAMDALALVVSDRIVGGVLVGGLTVVGRTGNSGNIGHMVVAGSDERCTCGGRGCLETVAGGAAILRWAKSEGWVGPSLAALVAAAKVGEDIPSAAVGRAGTALGQAIASTAALLDLDLVVLGGVVADAGPALWKPLGDAVATHARLSYLPGLRVIPSPLEDVGVMLGAGLFAMALREL
ncbi:ROK family protein [Nocardia australiensis]|uniref:ROK family protein n=1 Tax=Nocardia australiensis TaxID=2887191 RepID=UPI001D13DA8F|nr:ROK family protein [Nocardia australiensis]